MNSHPVFNSVRELISQGDADQALQILIAFLEKDGSHPESLHTLRVVEAKSFDSNTPSLQEATALGSQCQADMVIWGQYEPIDNSISVDIRYAFTAANWPPGAAIETFKNVTEIKADQMKITNLDEAVFRLFTAKALYENRIDLAEKWLSKLKQPNEREIQWRKMLEKK